MKLIRPLIAASVVALCLARPSRAAVVFYVNDQAGFNAAVASFTPAGTEDFEGSTLAAASITTLNDPLAPGVANAPFPSGTTLGPGVTVQSNTLGGSATTLSPRGVGGLATASAGYFGTPTDQVSNNREADSFDLTFAPANGQYVRAVAMAPLYFDSAATSATSNPGTLRVRVYGADQTTLLGEQTIGAVNYSGSSFLGIVTSGGDVIGRINVWDLDAALHFQGADNIAVHTSVVAPVELTSFVAE